MTKGRNLETVECRPPVPLSSLTLSFVVQGDEVEWPAEEGRAFAGVGHLCEPGGRRDVVGVAEPRRPARLPPRSCVRGWHRPSVRRRLSAGVEVVAQEAATPRVASVEPLSATITSHSPSNVWHQCLELLADPPRWLRAGMITVTSTAADCHLLSCPRSRTTQHVPPSSANVGSVMSTWSSQPDGFSSSASVSSATDLACTTRAPMRRAVSPRHPTSVVIRCAPCIGPATEALTGCRSHTAGRRPPPRRTRHGVDRRRRRRSRSTRATAIGRVSSRIDRGTRP